MGREIKFKIGDRVRVTDARAVDMLGIKVGDIGIIKQRGTSPWVQFSRKGIAADKRWSVAQEDLALIEGGKPAKPAPKAKWTKIPLDTNIAKSGLIDIANQLGAENARLKNQITKLKGAKA